MEDSTIDVGIGINSGEMVAGNLGSQKKMEYTVIGDNVNVASRLTSIAKAGEILVGSGTHALIKDKSTLKVEERGKMPVKGRKKEVSIFSVVGFNGVQYG
jgi:adenylate cyclase